jgi:hypothetical protein
MTYCRKVLVPSLMGAADLIVEAFTNYERTSCEVFSR